MKRTILLLLILLGSFANLFAQSERDSTQKKIRGIIKINPLQIFLGELRVSYEKPIRDKISFELGVGCIYGVLEGQIYGGILLLGRGTLDISFDYPGLILRSGFKFYKKNEQQGFYWNPLIFAKYYYYTPIENIYNIGFQILVGYKYPSKNKISFDFYGGLGIRTVFDKTDIFSYPTPQLGISIGYILHSK